MPATILILPPPPPAIEESRVRGGDAVRQEASQTTVADEVRELDECVRFLRDHLLEERRALTPKTTPGVFATFWRRFK